MCVYDATVLMLMSRHECVCAFCGVRLVCLGLHWVPLGSLLASADEESPDREKTPSTCWGDETNQYGFTERAAEREAGNHGDEAYTTVNGTKRASSCLSTGCRPDADSST